MCVGGVVVVGGRGLYALLPSLSYGTLSNSESRFPGARDLRLMVQRGQLHTSAAPSIQKRGRGQLRSRLNQPIEPLPPAPHFRDWLPTPQLGWGSSPPRSQSGSSIPALAAPPPGPRLLRPREAGLCPGPAFPRPPGGGGPWRARSLAVARAGAGTRSADWPARLGGAQEPGESLGEARQRPAAAGAQDADRSSRSWADWSPHIGAEAWR